MLQNAYFLAKIGADTAENEQHFAEILPIAVSTGLRVGLRLLRGLGLLRLEGRFQHLDVGPEALDLRRSRFRGSKIGKLCKF